MNLPVPPCVPPAIQGLLRARPERMAEAAANFRIAMAAYSAPTLWTAKAVSHTPVQSLPVPAAFRGPASHSLEMSPENIYG